MRLLKGIAKSMLAKVAAATVVLGGLLTFLPASASAAPVVVVRPGARVVVAGGFYGPRRVYVGPGFYGPRAVHVGPGFYGPVYVHRRYWDARFRCWRYR